MISSMERQDVNTSMDTSLHQQQPGDFSTDFTSLASHPDESLSQNSAAHLVHNLHSLFPLKVDSANTNPSSLHVSLSDSSTSPTTISAMDTSNTTNSARAPAPGFLPDFPPQNMSFGLPRYDSHLTINSSPSTTSTSSNPSSVIHGVASAYSMTGGSSMASVMGMTPHAQLESSVSPSNVASSNSEIGFSPLRSGPPTSSHDNSFIFPPPDMSNGLLGRKEESPDLPGDSHLMVVGDMLKNIAHTAHSASAACSMGQSTEAGERIDELRKTIALVSELIAATQITDPPSLQRKPSRRYSGVSSNASVSPPTLSGSISAVQEHHSFSLQYPNPGTETTAMDIQSNLDPTDMSRKRCASSLVGDRVIKALKLEPSEDTPLHVSLPNVPPASLSSHQSFSSALSVAVPTAVDPRSIPTFAPSNPPSEPSSRPTSSAGLGAFNMLSQPLPAASHPNLTFAHPIGSSAPSPPDFNSTSPNLSTPINHLGSFHPPPPIVRSSWSDGPTTLPHRPHHQHTLSGSALGANINLHSMGNSAPGSLPFTASGTYGSPPSSQSRPSAGAAISPPIGRVSRSSSFTNGSTNPFAFGFPDVTSVSGTLDFLQSRPMPFSYSAPHSPSSSQDGDYDNEHESDGGGDQSQAQTPESSSGHGPRNGTHSNQSFMSHPTASHVGNMHTLASHNSAENVSGSASNHGNEVPQEYRTEVDRIFFDFLNKICSNLDATDAKGEPIHQTLMAKKMQRLDESPDFRPFKFRIQAFTNAFLEELAMQGYPEEKIPMKKIRNYLWNQPYISRFNEDGKKAKSKGNHIWNIDAKKYPDGGWTFRPFHRRLAGSPPGVAYVGLRWSWTPRIWDPQASRANLPVTYSSPSLPSWLSWEDDVLCGTPTPDAENCDILVEARFVQDGQEEFLSQCLHLNIAPMSTLDTSFSASRRGSFTSDIPRPRRVASDSVVPQSVSPRSLRTQNGGNLLSPIAAQDAQVIQVLATAAQRVAQEAQSQVVASRTPNEPGPELQALAKQQHVLTVTAQAFDQEVTGQRSEGSSQNSNVLAAAAQQVVFQAARQVAADRSAAAAIQMSVGISPSTNSTQVTVNEVSVATQTAVAQAVEITGPLSSEVDVLMTASSLLQQQTRASVSPPPGTLDPSQLGMPMLDSIRSHSTGNLPPFSMGPSTAAVTFPPSVPSAGISEYASHI